MSAIAPAASEQHIQLSTASAKFLVSLSSEPARTFSTNQHFQFESITSKLFHTELSTHASNVSSNSHVVATGVHVERMRNTGAKNLDSGAKETADTATAAATLNLESIISVTFSDVGLGNAAVMRSPVDGGWEAQPTTADIASILTKVVSSSDILNILVGAELVPDDATVLDLSFAEFNGSLNERGMTFTETEIVSKNINDGWPMFFAGVMITLLAVSIASVGYWIYNKEKGLAASKKSSAEDDSDSCCDSVHYEGDIDVENATTASGVLGLKGRHPQAVEDENAHPNRAYRRKRISSSTGQTYSTSDASFADNTQKSGVASAPLGITSMRRLDSFLTPQKPKSDRVPLYDIERLTRT